MHKAVPPLQEMFNMAGMQLPNYLKGEDVEEIRPPMSAPTQEEADNNEPDPETEVESKR